MPVLTPAKKLIYALGNLSGNGILSTLSLVYLPFFLLEVVGLRPALAGLVPLVGRVVDAFTDPLMGRFSDAVAIRGERRRPYFLIACVPLAVSFTMMWWSLETQVQWVLFLYHAAAYSLLSTVLTVLLIPYLALVPEMARDYDERTSLQTYLNGAAIFGVMAALAMRPLAGMLGEGAEGFSRAAAVFGIVAAACWLAVHGVSFERPEYSGRAVKMGVVEGLRSVYAHRTFRQLTAIYLSGRISIDMVGAMLLPFFTYWIGRSEDFELVMLAFLVVVIGSLPFWLKFSQGRDKATVFVIGSVWWLLMQCLLFAAQPDWPRWMFFVVTPMLAVGYAAVDLMPWAMLGDVIDEDDLNTGERREGLYNGVFTFLRKLAGALAVFVAFLLLDLAGFRVDGTQSQNSLLAVRAMASFGPAFFLAVGIWFTLGYPLTRARHNEIISRLTDRAEP
jgi:Na+/melibiose symporter-like transporter